MQQIRGSVRPRYKHSGNALAVWIRYQKLKYVYYVKSAYINCSSYLLVWISIIWGGPHECHTPARSLEIRKISTGMGNQCARHCMQR